MINFREKFTSYERDIETDLDFAQARMYANKLGRFLCPDLLYIKEDRLKEPQKLNLFIYVRNNPLIITDSTGFDFEFKGKDKNKFIEDANNRDKAQFKVRLNDKGIVEIVNKDKIDMSKLSKSEKAMFDAITDTEHHAILVGVEANPYIDFGASSIRMVVASNDTGLNFIDTSDMSLLRKADKTAAGQALSHEMLEAYEAAKTGNSDYDTAHDKANEFFQGGTKPKKFNELAEDMGSPNLSGYSTKSTWVTSKQSISVNITVKFVTPIPRNSLPNHRPIGNITAIERIKE